MQRNLPIWRIFVIGGLGLVAPLASVTAQEKTDEAAALQRQAKKLAQLSPLAGKTGSEAAERWLEAEKTYLDALKIYERQMSAKHQQDGLLLRWCQCRNELGELQFRLLKRTEAKALFDTTLAYLKQVVPLRPKEPAFRFEQAKTHASLANAYQALLLYHDAEVQQRSAIDLLKLLVKDQPARAEYRLTLTQWSRTHAGMLLGLARFQDAESAYLDAQQAAEKLVADAPKSLEYARELAFVHNAYAYLVREAGRYPEAIDRIRAAIQLLAKLEAEQPDRPEYWHALPIAYRNLAQPLALAGSSAEVDTAKREAARLEAKLAQIPPAQRTWEPDTGPLSDDPLKQQQTIEQMLVKAPPGAVLFLQARLAMLKSTYGQQLFARGLRDEARSQDQQALDILAKLNAPSTALPVQRNLEAEVHIHLAGYYMSDGKTVAGDRQLRQGLAVLQKLADDFPETPHFRYLCADHLLRFTVKFNTLNQTQEATRYLKESQAVMKKLADENPRCPKYRRLHAQSCANLGRLLHADAEAEAAFREGLVLWSKLCADFPATAEFRQNWAKDCNTLGQFLLKRDKLTAADEAFNEMLRLNQRLHVEHPREPEYHAALAVSYLWLAQVREKQERPRPTLSNTTPRRSPGGTAPCS